MESVLEKICSKLKTQKQTASKLQLKIKNKNKQLKTTLKD